jgi:hypothetical protein
LLIHHSFRLFPPLRRSHVKRRLVQKLRQAQLLKHLGFRDDPSTDDDGDAVYNCAGGGKYKQHG